MVFNQPLSYRSLPPAVKFLLTATGIVFLLQWFLEVAQGPSLIRYFGLTPTVVVHQFWLWQPVTYLFLHGGFFHVLFNLFMLWSLGRELENRWGTKSFLFYYFLCGVGAAAFNLLLEPNSIFPVIGASGAIYGLLVAFAMMYPMSVFYIYFMIPMRAWQAVILFAAIEFIMGFAGTHSRLANIAHLGGMLTGFLYLKSGTLRYDIRRALGRMGDWSVQRKEKKEVVQFHELGQEVDRILEKISADGIASLTAEEQRLMERYSRMKTKR